MVDNAVIARKRIRRKGGGIQHLCLDKGYKSVHEEQDINQTEGMYYIYRTRRKRKQRKMMENMSKQTAMPSHKKYSPKRWVVSVPTRGTTGLGSIFTRYEKKAENYLGLVQLSCGIIIYRKTILG